MKTHVKPKATQHLFLVCLTLSFFSAQINAQAPISITSANMPGMNDTIRYSNIRPNSIDVNQTGPNFLWNYDTITAIGQGLYEYKSSLSTPYALYFLGLNKYGLKVADSIGFSQYTFKDIYNFYKKSTSDFQAEGIGFKYLGLPLSAYYSDPDEIYTFPLNYSDRDSTTFQFSVQLSTGITYTEKGYRINYVDGWGKIKTPHGNENCLRLVSTTIAKDSINFNGIGFSFPNQQRSYKWMTTTEKIPYLEVSGTFNGTFVATQARFRDTYKSFAGISEIDGVTWKNCSYFPNPASNSLLIRTPTNIITNIEIFDVSGNLVLGKKCDGEELIGIDTQGIAEGLYFLKFSELNNKTYSIQKLIIAR